MDNSELKKEDYVEPDCVLCGTPYGAEIPVKAVPQQRIRAKMDEYMERRDFDGARRHLLYWMEEAKLGNDLGGLLMLHNEMVGFCRKTGKREEAYESGEEAIRLLGAMGMLQAGSGSDGNASVSAGTTYINYATACNVFGDNEKSMELFRKAQEIYENCANVPEDLIGGLYNNMALTCHALGWYDEALSYYEKALEKMRMVPGGEPEQAITCLNMADTLEAKNGMEQAESEIYALLDRAQELLETAGGNELISRGYYAYVCGNCAPTFEHFGYFMAADDMKRIAAEFQESRP